VTPLSLGIETLGGVFTRLIERNTTIPARKSEIFSTASDNQPGVEIHVLQGERQFSKDNKTIGKFHLTDIPPAPRGVPQIEVTFDIDANGIVHVTVKDLGTGKQQDIRITASSGLSEEEIKRMVNDADKFADEDRKRKDKVEKVNQAESLIYSTERTLSEVKDSVPESNQAEVKTALDNLKAALESQDLDRINDGIEKLTKASHVLAEALYKKSAQQQAASGATGAEGEKGGPAPGGGKENVVDAEFEEVRDNKRP
jgi:molecular chaperone DnaK